MNASTWTYYAIARKDWALVSAERFETVEQAKEARIDYLKTILEPGDYRGKIVILRTEEVTVWDENGLVLREVRTALAGA